MIRRAARVDAIQPECVAIWRRAGKIWVDTSRQGDGCPDGWLFHWTWLPIEFKTGKAKLKPKQKILHESVTAKGGKIFVIRSTDEALALIGAQ